MQTTQGTLLDGRIHYEQPRDGYRTGIEPVILAASIPARPGQRVLEAGTGAGAALLCLCHRIPNLVAVGVERDPAMADLARRNAANNVAANNAPCTILTADILAPLDLPPFDHVFANPPWHDPASTRPTNPRIDAAKHRAPAGLQAWTTALASHMAPKATLTLILPAAITGTAIAHLHTIGLARLTLLPLWPRAAHPARIALLQAIKGPGPTTFAPGLTLQGEGAAYTPETERILRNGNALDA